MSNENLNTSKETEQSEVSTSDFLVAEAKRLIGVYGRRGDEACSWPLGMVKNMHGNPAQVWLRITDDPEDFIATNI